MRGLKALVIGMGILIVVGTAVIAVTFARRAADDGAASLTSARIALPAGARVIETALDGDRIALRIALADGTERVVVVDARTGRRVGAIDLVPAGARAGP